MDRKLSMLESQVSNFVGATIVGFLYEQVTGPDSNSFNAVESMVMSAGTTVLRRFEQYIPLFNKICNEKYSSMKEVIKYNEPAGVSGFMVGQTIAKYLKQT